MNNKWLTIDQAANILNVSAMTVRRRIEKGDIESKLENRRRLVCITDDTALIHTDEQITEQLRRENEQLKKQIDIQSEQINELRMELKQKDEDIRRERAGFTEASHRHDTVIMQMTKLLEYHQQPFWRKLFSRKALPPRVDEEIK